MSTKQAEILEKPGQIDRQNPIGTFDSHHTHINKLKEDLEEALDRRVTKVESVMCGVIFLSESIGLMTYENLNKMLERTKAIRKRKKRWDAKKSQNN
jgi:hypothetical protein